MKIYRYQVGIYEGIMDFTHGMKQKQNRIYIPGEGIIAYRNGIDFFTNNQESLAEAQKIIEGKTTYIREIEIPDNFISEVIRAGETLNQAKDNFQKTAKKLIEIISS